MLNQDQEPKSVAPRSPRAEEDRREAGAVARGAGMNCDQFEESWNDLLDAGSNGFPALERNLEAHATTCERCQAIAIRYQLLRQALKVLGAPPSPSAVTLERLRTSLNPQRPRGVRRSFGRRARIAASLATAATLFALAWSGWTRPSIRPTARPLIPLTVEATPPPPAIASALEQATSATIDLALEASAPATRIGRDVLGFEEPNVPDGEPLGEPDASRITAATEMLQVVGDRVKPISGSARHAFSFLLGPLPGSGQLTR